jgi:hypothetical protein
MKTMELALAISFGLLMCGEHKTGANLLLVFPPFPWLVTGFRQARGSYFTIFERMI